MQNYKEKVAAFYWGPRYENLVLLSVFKIGKWTIVNVQHMFAYVTACTIIKTVIILVVLIIKKKEETVSSLDLCDIKYHFMQCRCETKTDVCIPSSNISRHAGNEIPPVFLIEITCYRKNTDVLPIIFKYRTFDNRESESLVFD